ncbi:hypothetical protein MRB53_033554 [Persea americana]|uniref:Uncharacterized protein n=1 Tax=Persea americana TaxID=3435 RepID=A0ACC2KV10_PERAE|nr:hypothetical protein MRB53_033554 [Persea americana]
MERRSPHIGKPIRCKAAVCRGSAEELEIEEVEVAPPKAWEVRIKIICTSLCRTDITIWQMKGPGFYPRIFGHEAAGVVESVGEHVEEVKEGDFVVPVFLPNCGECMDCKSEKSNICCRFPTQVQPGMRDGTSRITDSKGKIVYNFLNVSSFSEYTVVDINNIVKIDSDIPPEKACLLSGGVSAGIGAAWKVAEVTPGSTVAIFGLGAVGLAVAEGARLRGASRIIGVDKIPEKFEIGMNLGLTDYINPADCGDKPVSEVIMEMTNGGADFCFECLGLDSVMKAAFASSRQGWGQTIIVGLEMYGSPIIVHSGAILRGKTMKGAWFGGLKPKSDIPLLVKRYMDKELNLDEFITQELEFKYINRAFELLLQGKSVRCIIWMDK